MAALEPPETPGAMGEARKTLTCVYTRAPRGGMLGALPLSADEYT